MATAWYKQVNPPQRKALFSAWLGYVFDGFDFMMIFYILHIIKADLGITDIQATLIGTVAFIARPIGGGFFGAMADKYGRKPMMMWAIFIYSVGTGLSGIATNLYMLAVCRFIVGLGMSGEYACASTYAVESWPKNLQSKAREGANKRGNSSRLTQSFHFFMFEPIFSPVNALNQPI